LTELSERLSAKEEAVVELETQLEMAKTNGTGDVSQVSHPH
jgi:hypothetical protein